MYDDETPTPRANSTSSRRTPTPTSSGESTTTIGWRASASRRPSSSDATCRAATGPAQRRVAGLAGRRAAHAATAMGQGPAAASDAPRRRNPRRFAALLELSRVQLVVGRRHRVRRAGLGADPPGHHTSRRIRLRLPVRHGVLPAVDPLGQHPGGRHTVAGAGAGVRAVSCDFRPAAVVVRQLPGWPIWFAVLWAAQEWLKSTVPFGGIPLGRGGRRPDRGPISAVGPAGQRSAALAWRSYWSVAAPPRSHWKS